MDIFNRIENLSTTCLDLDPGVFYTANEQYFREGIELSLSETLPTLGKSQRNNVIETLELDIPLEDFGLEDDCIQEPVRPQRTTKQELHGSSDIHDDNSESSQDSGSHSSEDVIFRGNYSSIESSVGDDFICTTDFMVYGVLRLNSANFISGVLTSWRDVGVHRYLFNLAEGWILLPPSVRASATSVSMWNAGTGIPFVMDGAKLKDVSPVRKQSVLSTDLPSKYGDLAKRASWVHQEWFTYHIHNMFLIIAPAVFDLRNAKEFPYLYKEEGGCGGEPPYQSLSSVVTMLHHYAGGRASAGILGIMEESYKIHQLQLQPNHALYMKAIHLAMSGDRKWLEIINLRDQLNGVYTRQGADDLIKLLRGTELPQEIKDLGSVIESSSVATGMAMSRLRSMGLIMTELDVRVALDSQIKETAIYDTRPMGQVLNEIKEKERAFKNMGAKTLEQLAEIMEYGPEEYRVEKPDIDNTNAVIDTLRNYYSMRRENATMYTSFAYTDTIRLFKTADIEGYLNKKTDSLLRTDFCNTCMVESIQPAVTASKRFEEVAREAGLDWVETTPMSQLVNDAIPLGLVHDDARIYQKVLKVARDTSFERRIFIIISNDVAMYNALRPMLIKHYEENGSAAYCLSLQSDEYYRLMFHHYLVHNSRDLNPSRFVKTTIDQPNKPMIHRQFHGSKPEERAFFDNSRSTRWDFAYNLSDMRKQLAGRKFGIFSPISKSLRNEAADNSHVILIERSEILRDITAIEFRDAGIQVLFDIPNIQKVNSGMFISKPSVGKQILKYKTGGYLSRSSIFELSDRYSWAERPLETLYAHDAFNQKEINFHILKEMRGRGGQNKWHLSMYPGIRERGNKAPVSVSF